jgi:hypothetical protein
VISAIGLVGDDFHIVSPLVVDLCIGGRTVIVYPFG